MVSLHHPPLGPRPASEFLLRCGVNARFAPAICHKRGLVRSSSLWAGCWDAAKCFHRQPTGGSHAKYLQELVRIPSIRLYSVESRDYNSHEVALNLELRRSRDAWTPPMGLAPLQGYQDSPVEGSSCRDPWHSVTKRTELGPRNDRHQPEYALRPVIWAE